MAELVRGANRGRKGERAGDTAFPQLIGLATSAKSTRIPRAAGIGRNGKRDNKL